MNSFAEKTVIVIPARYGSTRLPAKPLIRIAGHTLLERVWRITQSVERVSDVYVATDHEEIAVLAKAFGAQVLMTSADCRNGTERAAQVADQLQLRDEALLINLQGDAPLTPPWVVQAMVDDMQNCDADMGTPAIKLMGTDLQRFLEEKKITPASGTTVVMNQNQEALYFSKAVLPFARTTQTQVYRHIGLYAYRAKALRQLLKWPESPLEKIEKLEQLRALENGMRIKVTVVDYRGRAHACVDAPEDIARVEAIIQREGELIPFASK
jgi:3-deoxy-manno-octulosonate cytidylyltransferase (CMP-KDO synthetase)